MCAMRSRKFADDLSVQQYPSSGVWPFDDHFARFVRQFDISRIHPMAVLYPFTIASMKTDVPIRQQSRPLQRQLHRARHDSIHAANAGLMVVAFRPARSPLPYKRHPSRQTPRIVIQTLIHHFTLFVSFVPVVPFVPALPFPTNHLPLLSAFSFQLSALSVPLLLYNLPPSFNFAQPFLEIYYVCSHKSSYINHHFKPCTLPPSPYRFQADSRSNAR